MDWHEFFFRQVYLVASKSKDKSTKIGTVIVNDKNVVAQGYNGICRRVNDDIDERHERPAKYSWFEHSERNAIFAAARNGISTNNLTLYTSGFPCTDCARAIIQAGITTVYLHEGWRRMQEAENHTKWLDSMKLSRIMFEESGVRVEYYDKFLNVDAYINGKVFKV